MKNRKIIGGMLLALLLLIAASLTYGAVNYPWWQWETFSPQMQENFLLIRVPRVVSAVFVGAALALSGVVLRGYTHNTLADPGLIGITGGSQLGLLITVIIFPQVHYLWRFAGAFMGACLVMLLLFGVFRQQQSNRFILIGVAISAFCTGLVGLLASIFQKNTQLADWNAGGLQGVTVIQMWLFIACFIIGISGLVKWQSEIQLYVLNQTMAQNLGVNVRRLQWIVGGILALLIGSAVTLAGGLSFFGLMAAVVTEALVGQALKHSLPVSGLVGALFMLLADLVSRLWNAPQETSLVAIVAVLCAPAFFIFVRKRGENL